MHSTKLFSALSLIQSNMYYQTRKCNPEILLDIMIYNSYILVCNFQSMKSPVVEFNSLLKLFCLPHGLKTANYYRCNV